MRLESWRWAEERWAEAETGSEEEAG